MNFFVGGGGRDKKLILNKNKKILAGDTGQKKENTEKCVLKLMKQLVVF